MNNAVKIVLQDGYAEISYEDNGITKNKVVDVDDLHTVFKDNVDYDSGDLGIWGTNVMGIKRLISRGDKHWVIVEAINPLVTTTLGNTTHKDVPYPSLLMGVSLIKEGTRFRVDTNKTFILAHQNMITNSNDNLYDFPFSNVWQDTMGRICWGNISLPKLDSFAQSIGIMQIFLQGVMNTDLVKLGNLNPSGDMKPIIQASRSDVSQILGNMFKELIKIKAFPYQEVGLRKKNTYGDLIRYCKQNI
jgi:hypothetical protein